MAGKDSSKLMLPLYFVVCSSSSRRRRRPEVGRDRSKSVIGGQAGLFVNSVGGD